MARVSGPARKYLIEGKQTLMVEDYKFVAERR
jgi:hypothetical protein